MFDKSNDSAPRWLTSNMLNFVEKHSTLILIPLYLAAIYFGSIFLPDAISCRLISNVPGELTFHSTPSEIMTCFGGSDMGSYIRGAFALEEHGLAAFTSLGYGTWPPGFSFLELGIIRANILPFPIVLFSITALLWSIVFHRLYYLLRQTTEVGVLLAVFAPLFLLILPFIYNIAIHYYLYWSEPISAAIFLIAILDIWRLALLGKGISIVWAIYFGFLFAACAYLRAQYDLIFMAMSGMAFLVLLIHWKYAAKRDISNNPLSRKIYKTWIISILLIFATFQSLVLIYKMHRYEIANTATLASVSYIFENAWMQGDDLRARGGGFFVDGGGNSLCAVDAMKCSEFEARRRLGEKISIDEYMKAAFLVVINKPVDFFSYKFQYFWRAWINHINNDSLVVIFFNDLFSICLVIAGVAGFRKTRRYYLTELALFSAIFIGATAFSWIIHFEPRYLLPVKLIGFVWIFVIVARLPTVKRTTTSTALG